MFRLNKKIFGLLLAVIICTLPFSMSESEDNMPYIPKIKVQDVTYDLKDPTAHSRIDDLQAAFSTVLGDNVLNGLGTPNYWVSPTGSWAPQNGYYMSDIIQVFPGESYISNLSEKDGFRVGIYSTTDPSSVIRVMETGTFTIPENGNYMVMSFRDIYKDSAFVAISEF